VKERPVHLDPHRGVQIQARDTKLGKKGHSGHSNVSEEALKDLDDVGIVRSARKVKPSDILVGKITPKGETQLTPEEKLLRRLREKAGDGATRH